LNVYDAGSDQKITEEETEMHKLIFRSGIAMALMIGVVTGSVYAQKAATPADWAVDLQSNYRVVSNVVYLTANNVELKLDIYAPRTTEAVPTFVYFHGGGWVGGAKESNVMRLMPYLEKGWAAVNVQYRLGGVSLAPAAVEDCLCALRWIIANAEEYGFDTNRLVTSGNSAGGHLALTTGMIPESSGLDRQCPGSEELEVAAIVNWYGITDVVDLLDGPNIKDYAVEWLGSQPNRVEIADRVSPLNYVSDALPPIISIHGDADPVVPYSHATRLHDALERAGVPNQLVTVPGGAHGGFDPEAMLEIYESVFDFLDEHL
jgi:acetyl esterase/lipase